MRLLFLLIAAALAACAPGEPAGSKAGGDTRGWRIEPEGDLNAFFDCLDSEKITLVSAHRGGPAPGYPENALETFEHTLTLAPAMIEVDIVTSDAGVLYLMHDDTLERTTTSEGPVNELSSDELAKLRLKDHYGNKTAFAPPLFSDVLAWADGRTILQLDIKQSTRYEDVARNIKDQHAERRVIIIATSLTQAQKWRQLLPETMISLDLNSMSDLNRAVAGGAPAKMLLGFTGTEEPRPRLFGILEERGVEVTFGTLGGSKSIDAAIAASGDDAQYAELAAEGVDIIATDRPAEAHAALAAEGRGGKDGVCGISRAPLGRSLARPTAPPIHFRQ